MRKFISSLFLFLVIFLLIVSVKNQLIPYHVGNPTYSSKLRTFEANSDKFNAVAFGSSRIYRQLNPILLDSLLGNYSFSTYNLASAGCYNPESYFQYENFIESLETGEIKYAFLEIQPLHTFGRSNEKTTRGSYWNNLSFLNYSIKYILHSDSKTKVASIKSYISSFIFRLFDYSIILNSFNRNVFEQGSNGFFSLEDQMKVNTSYYNRAKEFQSDTTILNARIESAAQIASIKKSNIEVNDIHYKSLLRLIDTSDRNGIHLFLIIPPRLSSSTYKALIPICNALPDSNVIELAEYPKYKELYLVKNTFDAGHLNDEGADIFTSALAREVNEILDYEAEK